MYIVFCSVRRPVHPLGYYIGRRRTEVACHLVSVGSNSPGVISEVRCYRHPDGEEEEKRKKRGEEKRKRGKEGKKEKSQKERKKEKKIKKSKREIKKKKSRKRNEYARFPAVLRRVRVRPRTARQASEP